MYKILCSNCDFKADATLPPSIKNCLCCGKELTIKLEKNKSKISYEPYKLKKPLNKLINIELDGINLQFKENSIAEEQFSLEFATQTVEQVTRNGIKYKEKVYDALNHDLALFANALHTEQNLPFNHKFQYFKDNFSQQQIEVLKLMYEGKIRSKYEDTIIEEMGNLQTFQALLQPEMTDEEEMAFIAEMEAQNRAPDINKGK